MDWNGQIITATGSYNQTLTNTAGCDSVHTLNVTIIPSPSATITDPFGDTICSNQTYVVHGQANNQNYTLWTSNTSGTTNGGTFAYNQSLNTTYTPGQTLHLQSLVQLRLELLLEH